MYIFLAFVLNYLNRFYEGPFKRFEIFEIPNNPRENDPKNQYNQFDHTRNMH